MPRAIGADTPTLLDTLTLCARLHCQGAPTLPRHCSPTLPDTAAGAGVLPRAERVLPRAWSTDCGRAGVGVLPRVRVCCHQRGRAGLDATPRSLTARRPGLNGRQEDGKTGEDGRREDGKTEDGEDGRRRVKTGEDGKTGRREDGRREDGKTGRRAKTGRRRREDGYRRSGYHR